MIKKLIKDIIKGEGGFNKGEDISPKSESISNSPPSGKEGWLKAGVVGGYTMLIITDLRIHLPPPPTGTPPSQRRRMENTIDYQIIVEYYRLSNYYFPN